MNKLIIYKEDKGTVSVVHPTQTALAIFDIDEIAKRSVPHGKPYKIIDASELPSDRSQRDSWVVDDTDLTDGIGESQ